MQTLRMTTQLQTTIPAGQQEKQEVLGHPDSPALKKGRWSLPAPPLLGTSRSEAPGPWLRGWPSPCRAVTPRPILGSEQVALRLLRGPPLLPRDQGPQGRWQNTG